MNAEAGEDPSFEVAHVLCVLALVTAAALVDFVGFERGVQTHRLRFDQKVLGPAVRGKLIVARGEFDSDVESLARLAEHQQEFIVG